MAVSGKPVIIFVPGAGHAPICFSPVMDLLASVRYETAGVALPSNGSELRGVDPPQNWDQDIAAIRQCVITHVDQGKDVVLVVHSYGGSVGSEAMKGLGEKDRKRGSGHQGAVIKLVYLTALALDVGQSAWQTRSDQEIDTSRMKIEGDLCFFTDMENWLYNECSAEQTAELKKQLQSFAMKSFLCPVTHTAWRDIPSVYLLCENDKSIPLRAQEAFVNAAGCFEVERCDADHSPFRSRPEITAKLIRRAAGEK